MRNFLPPSPKGWPPLAWGVSAVIHLAAIGGLVWLSAHSPEYSDNISLVRLYEASNDAREYRMILLSSVTSGEEREIPDAVAAVGPLGLAAAPISSGGIGFGVREPIMLPEPTGLPFEGASRTVPGAIVVGTSRAIGPGVPDERIWRLPGAAVGSGGEGDEDFDWGPNEAMLAARIVEMLDSVLVDSSRIEDIPSWLFEAGGNTWGIDQQFIHLGPIKLPTALLALLPIPDAGNYAMEQRARWLRDVRNAIDRQAQDKAGMALFRRGVNELRDRMEREREEQRRRERVAARDTVIP
ncbi:MAG: hypothetical protein OEY63_03635 [Gemmatimonadota bacterium]|nr:hypothetical protein [Gemmatimonadota bacterium]